MMCSTPRRRIAADAPVQKETGQAKCMTGNLEPGYFAGLS